MPLLRSALPLLAFAFAGAANAQVTPASLSGDTVWYLHADLQELRDASSGKHIYQWLEDEVFTDIREDLGIDLGKEANSVTAFSDKALGTVIVVDGAISKTTSDKLLALAATDARLETRTHGGKTYYHADRKGSRSHNNRSFDDLEESAWFSFDVKGKVIVASDQNQMQALLESGGRIAGNQSHPGALLVLTADKSYVQAGARTAAFMDDDDDGGWDSNILRNTELVALLVSDRDGLLAVEAQLVSHEPRMAQSLGGIINGLISLQTLNPDLDPEILSLIQNTKVEVKDKVLSINAVINPEMVIGMLED
ncbi:MAG: hypothetical protein WD795_01730 [Woeseia sp.]